MTQEQYNLLLLILAVIMIVMMIAVFVCLYQFFKNNRQLSDQLKQQQFDLNKELYSFSDTTSQSIHQLEERVASNLIQNSRNSNRLLVDLFDRMGHIDQAQKNLDEISKELLNLKTVLYDKKNRGIFGEVELYSLLESVFGNNEQRFKKQCRLSNGCIVDAAVNLGEDGLLCIDSKFPLENFQRLDDNDPKTYQLFRADILHHIKDIASKYLLPNETCEVALMFVPSEAVFAKIYEAFGDVVEKGYNAHVYIVSPTTLMAYLTIIRSLYLHAKRNEKAAEIEKELKLLQKEFVLLNERTDQLKKDYQKIVPDFEKLTITINKLCNRFKDLESGE